MNPSPCIAKVWVDLPRAGPLDYIVPPSMGAQLAAQPLGRLCVVPLGRRQVLGLVLSVSPRSELPAHQLKPLIGLLDLCLPAGWMRLIEFAADYYHHGQGETALAALPRLWRSLTVAKQDKAWARWRKAGALQAPAPTASLHRKALNEAQAAAVASINASQGFACQVLFGVTGSGKTEVYLEAMAQRLAASAQAQVLLLVPEINLTPQLEARVRARFPLEPCVNLHSAIADGQRAAGWLAALEGRARIVLGTRSAVFVPMPHLALICVDEEHDASYKAADGLRYSGRDLAVKRAQLEGVGVVLGSATPSLETWAKVRAGRYGLLALPQRASAREGASAVRLQTVDLRAHRRTHGLTEPVRAALAHTLARGAQSLVFLNRRGFAPVLSCESCGWLSACPRCDVYAAYHRADASLRCHHCGWAQRVPAACPACGNQDLSAVGAGTQRIEQALQASLPEARIARLDRDSTRRVGTAQGVLDAVHEGQTDILVGTQMLTKGHDFQRVDTVVVLGVDAQLVSHDFRAAERLFAMLTQVIGRAGRAGQASDILIETRFPGHPLFDALALGDYARFADAQLLERRHAQLPPYIYQALLSAESSTLKAAMELLVAVKDSLLAQNDTQPGQLTIYDPVPMALQKRANIYRAQLVIESTQRRALHAALARIDFKLTKGLRPAVRLRIEVDPQEI